MKLYIEFEIDDDRMTNPFQAEAVMTKRLQELLLRLGPNDLKVMGEQSFRAKYHEFSPEEAMGRWVREL